MKQRKDKTNRKTTALAGAVAAANIGFFHLFCGRVRSRHARAGYRRHAAPVEAFGAVSAMGSKNLRPASPRRGAARPAGLVARPLQPDERAPTTQCKLSRQSMASPARLGLSV